MIWRLLFFIVYLLFFLIRAPHMKKQNDNKYEADLNSAIKNEGKIFQTVRSFLSLLMLLSILAYGINPSWLSIFALSLPVWLRCTAFIIALSTLPVLSWAHQYLGRQYSPDLNLKEGHKLITSGPYKLIRHPMYTILIIFMFCVSLLTANLLILIPHLMAILLILLRLNNEETMLLKEFGDNYREYMLKTGRLLPKLYHPFSKA